MRSRYSKSESSCTAISGYSISIKLSRMCFGFSDQLDGTWPNHMPRDEKKRQAIAKVGTESAS